MPSRSAENGRQVVADRAWIASQERSEPGVATASLPPTIAARTWPLAIRPAPWAMACADDAQALEVANTGPWIWKAMATALAAALIITLGMVAGCSRGDRMP